VEDDRIREERSIVGRERETSREINPGLGTEESTNAKEEVSWGGGGGGQRDREIAGMFTNETSS